MKSAWQEYWLSKETEINTKYKTVHQKYEIVNKKGKKNSFSNWSGKSIREMAIEVKDELVYDVFYTKLSSFTHADVRLANNFLRMDHEGMFWSQRTGEISTGFVFRYAANFLTDILELFAEQFELWTNDEINNCWNVGRPLDKEL